MTRRSTVSASLWTPLAALLLAATSSWAVLTINIKSPTGMALPNADVVLIAPDGARIQPDRRDGGAYVFNTTTEGKHSLEIRDASLSGKEIRTVNVTGKDQTVKIALKKTPVALAVPKQSGLTLSGGFGLPILGGDVLEDGYSLSLEARYPLLQSPLRNLELPYADQLYLFGSFSYLSYYANEFYFSDMMGYSFRGGVGGTYWFDNYSLLRNALGNNAKWILGLSFRSFGAYTMLEGDLGIGVTGTQAQLVQVCDMYGCNMVKQLIAVSNWSDSDSTLGLGIGSGLALRNPNTHFGAELRLDLTMNLNEMDFDISDEDVTGRLEITPSLNIDYGF